MAWMKVGATTLSPPTPTYEPDLSSSSGWALTNGGGTASIANNEVTLTANSNADNPIATYDLGATLSDTAWVMTFKLVYSGLENSAIGQGVIYGVGLGSSATTTDLDGWSTAGMSFIEYDFRAHASTSVVQPHVAGGNSSGRTETVGSTIADPYSATQYVKLYRLTSTTARMEFYLQSDYSDTPVTLNVTMANTPSGLQYVFLRLFYQNVSNSNTIVASEFKIYNGITDASGASNNISVANLADRKHLMVIHNHLNNGTTMRIGNRMNNTGGSDLLYAERRCANGGNGTDDTNINASELNITNAVNTAENWLGINYIMNISGQEKLQMSFYTGSNTSGAGNAPNRTEVVSKFVPSSLTDSVNRWDSVRISGSGQSNTNSNISVLGTD